MAVLMADKYIAQVQPHRKTDRTALMKIGTGPGERVKLCRPGTPEVGKLTYVRRSGGKPNTWGKEERVLVDNFNGEVYFATR